MNYTLHLILADIMQGVYVQFVWDATITIAVSSQVPLAFCMHVMQSIRYCSMFGTSPNQLYTTP